MMDRVKFHNTVVYLLRACAPNRPGLTTLLKMLYFADYTHYRRFLAPITGAQYVALERGPAVDNYKEVFDEMTKEGIVELHEASILYRKEKKWEYRPLVEPDVHVFSQTELDVLDSVAEFGSKTGVVLSEKTHLEGPWQYVWDSDTPGSRIPYALFRWVDNLPDEDDLAEAGERISGNGIADKIAALNSAEN